MYRSWFKSNLHVTWLLCHSVNQIKRKLFNSAERCFYRIIQFIVYFLEVFSCGSADRCVDDLTLLMIDVQMCRTDFEPCTCCSLTLSSTVSAGFWRTREELKKLQNADKVFVPRGASTGGAAPTDWEHNPALQSWERALRRSMNWYKPWCWTHWWGHPGHPCGRLEWMFGFKSCEEPTTSESCSIRGELRHF